jgi:rare lipoprotein A
MAASVQSGRLGALTRLAAIVAGGLMLANCASSDKFAAKVDPKYGVTTSPRMVEAGRPIPKGGGTYRVGKPYTVAGRTYVPEENADYRAEGMASWYGEDFHGRLTANGEIFDMNSISAAHPTLPLPSYVRVTNLENQRSIVVRVNDRGPYHGDRVIDLSVNTAKLLGFHDDGLVRVRVEYVARAPLSGSDDRKLIASLRHNGRDPSQPSVMVASAKPFVPEFKETRVRFRNTAPVPPDRPFSQDTPLAPATVDTPTDVTAVSRLEAAGRGGFPAMSPISAYAPRRPEPIFMSGRGLY